MPKAETDNLTPVRHSAKEFKALSLAEKSAYLRKQDARKQMELILDDPDARRLTASLQPQEFFSLVKEIGESDALELLDLASGEQCLFLLDMELWDGWRFSEENACRWLGYFLEGGEARFHRLLRHLDFEWLLLFLNRQLVVRGGIGDLAHDEERYADYDFTFDDVFYLTFRNPKQSQLIGSFLTMLVKLDRQLYVALMEEIKGSLDIELEEECLRARRGRLQDLGFPPLEEALSVYARIDPATFRLRGGKELLPTAVVGALIPVSLTRETLLSRALTLADSEPLLQELNYLVNSALVAEDTPFADAEAAGAVLERVSGYLNIALEYLSQGDEQEAVRILLSEELKRLFQFGFSVVLGLQSGARDLESSDYASAKALAGLRSKRPRYYRGLDPEGVDGYREFRDMGDLKRAAKFLSDLRG